MSGNRLGPPPILAEGTDRAKGRDAMRMNIMAARTIAESVRSTLGPMGMDKMLVDSLGDVIVTNDGATILREMDVQHPVARMLIEVAKTQESYVGDGTTTAVVFAGELLKEAEKLIEMGVHPIIISKGYRLAAEKCERILNEIAINTGEDDRILKGVAMTTMTGKGTEDAKEMISEIIVRAVRSVTTSNNGYRDVDIDYIKLEKREGGSVRDTEFINGIILDKEKAHHTMPVRAQKAKIALVGTPLEFKAKSVEAKINVTDPEQLKAFVKEEKLVLKDMVEKIRAAGVTVLFTEKNIDNLVVSLLAKEGILAVRRVRRGDMEKLARATGANMVDNLDELAPESLGFAGTVDEKTIGGKKMIFVKECRNPRAVSILVRGGSTHVVDEAERAIEDCLGSVPAVVTDGRVVVGGGAAEMEAANRLRIFAQSSNGVERLAIEAFVNALEIIPKSLAENAGLNPLDVIVEMRSRNEREGSRMGLDVFTGEIGDLFEKEVIEPLRVKKHAISSGSEVALMILRIDDIIAAKKLELPTPGDITGMARQG